MKEWVWKEHDAEWGLIVGICSFMIILFLLIPLGYNGFFDTLPEIILMILVAILLCEFFYYIMGWTRVKVWE